MARVPTPFTVQDSFGNALDGTAYLYLRDTTTPANVFSTESGGSALAQPFTFLGGTLDIWANPGAYDIAITTTVGTHTQPWDAVEPLPDSFNEGDVLTIVSGVPAWAPGGGGGGAVGSWVSLTSYLETGWTGGGAISGSLSDYDLMYYIDRDRVYLRGAIVNTSGSALQNIMTGTTLVPGIPAEIKPQSFSTSIAYTDEANSSSTAIKFWIVNIDPANGGGLYVEPVQGIGAPNFGSVPDGVQLNMDLVSWRLTG
jgi:hypothetical protein